MNNNSIIKTLAVSTLVMLTALQGRSQEAIKPLSGNVNYFYGDIGLQQQTSGNTSTTLAKSATGTLFLPFKEDFSYALQSNYPNQSLWKDSTVYINTGFAIAPLGIGVATFDGLNKNGYPYNPTFVNLSYSAKADTLTSRPINLRVTASSQTLQPTDNVALSFYYQAGGKGDYPEPSDSIVLDFYNPVKRRWIGQQWYKTGPSTVNFNDSAFKRAFVWIKDQEFLQDSFQFRFRNYATTAGDFDHWNIDYIYLNKNRDSIADTSSYDIAFAAPAGSMLQKYSAMPYEQYQASEMGTRSSVRIRNNHVQSLSFSYNYKVPYDKLNTGLVYSYTDFDNLPIYRNAGYCSYLPISSPKIDTPFKNVNANYDFAIRHTIALTGGSSSGQFFTGNDTIIQTHPFRNYYAFDDGAAEAGYYILGAGAKMAVKIALNKADTILGANIYFEHVGNFNDQRSFTLCVWSAGSNGPGSLILKDTASVAYIKTGFKEIPQYAFNSAKVRALNAGTYYVGIQQSVATGMNIGFDLNTNHNTALYYDSGSGWTQSSIYGSVMIRPVFKSFDGTPVGIKENKAPEKKDVSIYPNPANDWLNIVVENNQSCKLQMLNSLGQLIKEDVINGPDYQLSTAQVSNGIYYLVLSQNGLPFYQQKLIIGH